MNIKKILVSCIIMGTLVQAAPKIWFETDDNQLITMAPRQVAQFRTLKLMVGDISSMTSGDDQTVTSSKKNPFPIANVSKKDLDALITIADALREKKEPDIKSISYLLDKLPVSGELTQDIGIVRLIKAANFLDADSAIVGWLHAFFARQIRSGACSIRTDLGFPPEVVQLLSPLIINDSRNDVITQAYRLKMVEYQELFVKSEWDSYDYAPGKNLYVLLQGKDTIAVIDGRNGTTKDTLVIGKPITYYAVSYSGDVLITSHDAELVFWDIRSKEKIHSDTVPFKIRKIVSNKDGSRVAVAGERKVGIYTRKSSKLKIVAEPIDYNSIAMDVAGEYLAYYIPEAFELNIYSTKTGSKTSRNHKNVEKIILDNNGKLLGVIGKKFLEIFNYSLKQQELLSGAVVMERGVFDRHGALFALLYDSGRVDVFDQKDFSLVRNGIELPSKQPIEYIQFKPNDHSLVMVSKNAVGYFGPLTILRQLKNISLEQAALLATLTRKKYKKGSLTEQEIQVLNSFDGELGQLIKSLVEKPSLLKRIQQKI